MHPVRSLWLTADPARFGTVVDPGDLRRWKSQLPEPSRPIWMAEGELLTASGQALESQLKLLGYVVRVGADRISVRHPLRAWSPSPLVSMLARNIPPGLAVDLGCGGGRDAVFLASRGWNVTAVDALADCIERALTLERSVPVVQPVGWHCDDVRGDYEIPPASVYLFIRFFDLALWTRLAESANPGAIVAVQTFSEKHRATTGHPRSDRTVWRSTTPDFGWHVRYAREKGPFQYRILQKPAVDDVNSAADS
jgi:SAM-dependent methyltransferase